MQRCTRSPSCWKAGEAKPGAADGSSRYARAWCFTTVRLLDADDVYYLDQPASRRCLTVGDQVESGDVTKITKLDPLQILDQAESGNADLPYLLSDYHLLVVPNGFKDWSHQSAPAFRVGEPRAGASRCSAQSELLKPMRSFCRCSRADRDQRRHRSHERTDLGQVHAITGRLQDRRLAQRSPTVNIVRSLGGQHFTFLMDCATAPFADNNVRLAVKYDIDRQKQLTTILRGYGTIGNDHPIPKPTVSMPPDLPQHAYDPDKSKFI